jgi:hypothetical protein
MVDASQDTAIQTPRTHHATVSTKVNYGLQLAVWQHQCICDNKCYTPSTWLVMGHCVLGEGGLCEKSALSAQFFCNLKIAPRSKAYN